MANTPKHARTTGLAGFIGASALLILVAVCMVALAGCSSAQIEQYQAAKAELVTALDEAKAQLAAAHELIAELNAQIDATEEGPDRDAAIAARDQVKAVIDKAQTAIPELEEGITQLTAAIDAGLAGNTAEAVQIGGRYVAAKAPPPWNTYLLAGTTILGALLTYRQKRIADEEKQRVKLVGANAQRKATEARETRAAAASVIEAIEYEKGNDEVVDFSDPATKVSLRASMSTEARDLVEQTRRQLPPRVATPKTVSDSTAA